MSIIRADSIKSRSGSSAPTAPDGLIVTGICTATSFVGSGANLTGIDATAIKHTDGSVKAQAVAGGVNITGDVSVSGALGVGGVLTYEDVANIDSVGIITARTDVLVGSTIKLGASSGIVTATSYRGDGSQLTGISVGIATEASTATDGTTVVLDLSKDDHKVLAAGVVTIDVTGGTEGDSHVIRVENTGIATVGFATHFLFPGGGSPGLPTASGAKSLISFTVHKVGAAGTELFTGASVNFS